MRLSIISFNIRNDVSEPPHKRHERARETARFLEDGKPDILCLQEVVPETFQEISEALQPDFATFCPREDGNHRGEGVPILVCDPSLRVTRNERFWLSATPEKPSLGWSARCHRIVSAVRLERPGETRFWILNLHLDHRSRRARANSLQLLRRKIATYGTKPTDEFILCGDFNMRPTDALFPPFLEGNPPLSRSGDRSPAQPTFRGLGPLRLGRAQLDHCLHSPGFATESYQVLDPVRNRRRLSDHRPVRVELVARD